MFPIGGILTIFTVLSLLLLSLILYIKWKRRKYSHIYCPKYTNFLLAHLKEIVKSGNFNQIILQWANECDGTALVLFSSWRVHIHFFHPDFIREILGSSKFMKAPSSLLASSISGLPMLGKKSLLTDPGTKQWAHKRRKLDPFFHANGLKKSHSDMVDIAMTIVKSFLEDAKSSVVTDVSSGLLKGVAFVIAKVILGISDQEGFYLNYAPKLTRVLDSQAVKMRNKNTFWLPWAHIKLKKECKSDITELREYFKSHVVIGNYIIESTALGQVISSNSAPEGVDLESVVNDLVTFFFAGIETSVHTMNFALYEMLRNPDQFQEVEEEVLEVYGSQDTISYSDLKEMKILDNFIKETLRLHPVVSGVPRVSGNIDISVCGLHVPANTTLHVGIESVQKLDKYWDDPLKFNMKRWNTPPKPFTYLPFSGGVRSCIGKQFALAEIKVFLSMIIRHCKFEPQEDLEIRTASSITNKLAENLIIQFYPRDNERVIE